MVEAQMGSNLIERDYDNQQSAPQFDRSYQEAFDEIHYSSVGRVRRRGAIQRPDPDG
jgi:hypothetical protein